MNIERGREILVEQVQDASHSPMYILSAANAFLKHFGGVHGERIAAAVDIAVLQEIKKMEQERVL